MYQPLRPEAGMSLSYYIMMFFAAIGAITILSALTGVSLMIGGLVNAMIVLMSGPLIDRLLSRRRS
jgi:hypothetical protein